MIFVAGIDVGSRSTKAVIVDADRRRMAGAVERTKPNLLQVAEEALAAALAKAGIKRADLGYIAATGFGRYSIPFRDIQITDVTAAARGAAFLLPETHCVLDIGFQSTRAIRLRARGRVERFQSNDRCAAGAGGFLERVARYLESPLEELGQLSLRADNPQSISSVCAVLAESEIINQLTEGQSRENIIRGVHDSLSSRAQALLKRVGLGNQVTLVGGVAKQLGMIRALEEGLGVKVEVPEAPEYTAALGAALLALRRMEKLGRSAG